MNQRIRFISEYLNGYFPTAYKWIKRYEEHGGRRSYPTDHTGPIIVPMRQIRISLMPLLRQDQNILPGA